MAALVRRAYYNENDPYAAQWLRNLIAAGELPPGDVDDRNIQEITPDDLKRYTQCHFFAGIGGWSYAFRLAWPDELERQLSLSTVLRRGRAKCPKAKARLVW